MVECLFYEVIGSVFESRCCHLNFCYCTCFEQGVPWHSGNNRLRVDSFWKDSECRFTLKSVCDMIITYSQMHHTDKSSQSVRLWTKWLWVWVPLLSLKLQILCLFWARSSLAFRQLQSVDSFSKAYITYLIIKTISFITRKRNI